MVRDGRLVLLALSLTLPACVSPVALEEAVRAYDRTLSRVRSQTLLMNVARARHGLPLNASEVTALTASFEFSAQASVGGVVGPIGGPADPTGRVAARRALHRSLVAPLASPPLPRGQGPSVRRAGVP